MVWDNPCSSCPDVIRASTEAGTSLLLGMDGRVKPGHDEGEISAANAAMTVLDNREDDLARENALLRRQLAEAQAQQDAAGEILQIINSSRGDLSPVFQAVLESRHSTSRRHRACGGRAGRQQRFALQLVP